MSQFLPGVTGVVGVVVSHPWFSQPFIPILIGLFVMIAHLYSPLPNGGYGKDETYWGFSQRGDTDEK